MHRSTAAKILWLPVALALGCADDNTSVFITGNILPSADENTCTWDPSSGNFLIGGTYDVLGRNSYFIYPAVVNQIIGRGNTRMADPNDVFIERAEVALIDGRTGDAFGLGDLPNPFSVTTSMYAPSASDPTNPGRGTGRIEAIPVAYRQSLIDAGGVGSTVLVEVRLFGRTSGSLDIETGTWTWPVEICSGCLTTCVSSSSAGFGSVACTVGQDTAGQVFGPDRPAEFCEICQDQPSFQAGGTDEAIFCATCGDRPEGARCQ